MLAIIQKILGLRRPQLLAAGRTDTGRVREHNEDSFAILPEQGLFMVTDGMGGHNAGEVASRMTIEALVEYFTPERLRQMQGNPEETRHSLIQGVRHANQTVIADAGQNPDHRGMGCTLVLARLDRNLLHICHAGDARCYLDDGHELRQLTTDHAGVAFAPRLQEAGGSEKPARQRPVVTMAIGFPFRHDPEYHALSVTAGHRLLLCSDGLWSMLPDREIHAILQQAATPQEACDRLISQANQAGGRDNITAVAIFL